MSVNRTSWVWPTVAYSGTLSRVRPSSSSCTQIDVSLNYKQETWDLKSKFKYGWTYCRGMYSSNLIWGKRRKNWLRIRCDNLNGLFTLYDNQCKSNFIYLMSTAYLHVCTRKAVSVSAQYKQSSRMCLHLTKANVTAKSFLNHNRPLKVQLCGGESHSENFLWPLQLISTST